MAAGTLPTPGKIVNGMEIGPCVNESCVHLDCAKTRNMATMECPYCDKPIGYETPFYMDGDQLMHALCHESDMD
jgi:hypothetical protein